MPPSPSAVATLADEHVAPSSDQSRSSRSLSRNVWIAIGLVVLVGALVRLVNIGEPMFDFHPTRQYISVDLAWKYDMAAGAPSTPADREAATIRSEIEPPVMEIVTAAIWRATGDRPLWVPRLLTILIWSAGGIAIALLLRRLAASSIGIVTGVAVWMFVPFVIQATRVFQPDPLMIVAILFAVLALVVDDDRRTTRSLVVAGLAGAVAIFVKAPALFFVAASFAALTTYAYGVRALWSKRTLTFGALAIAPALIYNALGLWVFGFIGAQDNFVYPRLLTTAHFWSSWFSLVDASFGVILVVLAVVGVVLSRGRGTAICVGLFAGYFAYGLVFTWNYLSHDYYHLPLILPIALSIGLLASEADSMLRRRHADPRSVGLVTGFAVLLLLSGMRAQWSVIPPPVDTAAVDRNVRVSQEVGAVTDHTDRALLLGDDYGYPLAYYGSVKSDPWPWIGDLDHLQARGAGQLGVAERFDELSQAIGAEYFIVTDMDAWNVQPELEAFLRSRYPVVAETDDYLVFDLRSGVGTGG